MRKSIIALALICVLSLPGWAQQVGLDHFVGQALQNSPLIKDLKNQVAANKLDSMRLRAGYGPQVGFNSTGNYSPSIRGFGFDEALSNGQTFSALATINQSINGKKRVNTQLNEIGLTRDSVSNSLVLSSAALQRTITEQYITVYAAQQQYDFNKEVFELFKNEELILKKLTRSNVYKQTDYLTFLVSLQQQELQMKQSRISFLNNLAILNYLSGINDTTLIHLAEPMIARKAEKYPQESIFLKQYRLDSLRLQNNRQLVDINYRPKVGAYADAGYNSSFKQPYKNFGTAIGFTLSVPIYDGHQRKLQYHKIDLAENTRVSYRDFFVNQYHQQIELLEQQLQKNEELFQQLNEQIRYTESLIKVNARLLPSGDIRIVDYILAINNYMNARNLLRQTNITRLQLINQLNYWNQ
ncbi:MAG TPA: TolC family protein [Daejeonella sp.]|nr:TolC family protein [Daejeonella sp.]